MKRIIALVFVAIMALSLVACSSSPSQSWLNKYEKIIDEAVSAIEAGDKERFQEVREDAAAHREELNAIYEELEAQDPEAAETFEEQVEALDEKVEEALEKADLN